MPNIKSNIKDVILGGQDGLVNVLGVILGVSAATPDLKIIIISGLAATFAESISMAAVAYTSTEASLSKYMSDLKEEETEVEKTPEEGVSDVKKVFKNWGFEGELLENATKQITSNKKTWTTFMMSEERKEELNPKEKPLSAAIVVGLASLIGSFIPLLPYLIFKNTQIAIILSFSISSLFLFLLGYAKAKLTVGNPLTAGIKITAIGITSAIVGFIIGKILGSTSI